MEYRGDPLHGGHRGGTLPLHCHQILPLRSLQETVLLKATMSDRLTIISHSMYRLSIAVVLNQLEEGENIVDVMITRELTI